jgi:hypothetical protein
MPLLERHRSSNNILLRISSEIFKKIFIKNYALAIFNTTPRNAYMFFYARLGVSIQKRSGSYKTVRVTGKQGGTRGERSTGQE